MDPVSEFNAERKSAITDFANDSTFRANSQRWLRESMKKRYVYNFDWLGRPIIQYPQDMQAVQEIIWATKPDLVIETGIAHGGSLVFSASLLAMLDYADAVEDGTVLDPKAPGRKVVGIDIDIRPHNRAGIMSHPLSHKIEMIEGSSIAPETVARVRAAAEGHSRVMVCLDSMHTHDHVLAELAAYGPMVSEGCYCIVFDTFIEDMEPGFFADRPWDVGDNPKTAVHEWLATAPEFDIDRDIATKLMVTVAPDGFLKRSTRVAAPQAWVVPDRAPSR